jgi:hypothetical protein
MQSCTLRKSFLRDTELVPPLPDGEAEPLFDLWCAFALDGFISTDVQTMRLQEISDNFLFP